MAKKLKISADISRLFTEMDITDRFAAAADATFSGVDIPLPYDQPAPDLRDKAIFSSVSIVRIDAPPPNYTGGPQGFAALPDCVDRFRRDVVRVGRQADVFGCQIIHLRAGLEGESDAKTLTENLIFAAEAAPKKRFLIEILNPEDHPGHCLSTTQEAIDIVATVNKPNVRLLFSTFHAAKQAEGLAASWEACAPLTGHILLGGGTADAETHHADEMLALVRKSDYAGWLCASYTPTGDTRKSLRWLKP